MTKATVIVMLALFPVISNVYLVDSLIHEGLGKFLGSFSAFKQVKIPELLNQLCNDSQGSNVLQRDACYGCFYRASILPQGYVMLIAMSACANNYLNNTSYGHCRAYLQNATTTPNTQVSPTIIYCTFLECIRQVNKDSLVRLNFEPIANICYSRETLRLLLCFDALNTAYCAVIECYCHVALLTYLNLALNLRECVREAARMFPRFSTEDAQLARLFINTTACVLAKTRCSYVNPVTGEFQNDDINKLHLPSINAVLVNTDYDVNIVQLPFRLGGDDVCARYRNVQQATWPGVVC